MVRTGRLNVRRNDGSWGEPYVANEVSPAGQRPATIRLAQGRPRSSQGRPSDPEAFRELAAGPSEFHAIFSDPWSSVAEIPVGCYHPR